MALSFSKTKKAVLGAVAALTLGGAMLASTAPAEAQWRGGWRGGGWHGAAWRGGWHHRRHWGGGLAAAGLVGGLALASAPYYYGYPYGGYYYPAAYGYGGDCWIEKRVRVNRWGERIVRRVQICG
ncbi:MAG TPA: hypothetical protein VF601_07070 [Beijerinckiaceae bacterium]